jgi:cell division cycle 2-like
MGSKIKSRWAVNEEDSKEAEKTKREKEERKRLKAEMARKLEEERQAKIAAQRVESSDTDEHAGRPAKRRRLTPERTTTAEETDGPPTEKASRLVRFPATRWAKCRSVENYDKLNDIEEGTYGWVARAKEIATGKVVALKRLKLEPNDRNGLPVTGLREIQILRDCDHINIVKLQEVVVGGEKTSIER